MLALLIAGAITMSPAQAYDLGNRLYAQKDYGRATDAYREALTGGHDARVHYNLGNALFKSGKIGEAILNYRRARYLAPRDPDIRANLAFARAFRVDKLPSTAGPLARALDRGVHWLSRREAALAAAVAFALAGLALAGWIVWRHAAAGPAAAVFGVVALVCFACQQAWTGEVDARPAVVVVPEIDALSGPSEESKQIMLLHDGTEVEIRESRAGFYLVQLPGGSGGWIRQGGVELVY
ncbi:MAG TPA: tetratricopeptide repeat protein [Candidatus Eisenbacteria bacterium]